MYLVFDVGGTHTRVAISRDGQKLDNVVRFDTDVTASGFSKLLAAIGELAHGHKLEAVAGGLPGNPNVETGLWRLKNIPRWNGLPISEKIEKLTGCPVFLGNDAVVNGLGEAHHGAGSTEGVMTYYTISTGVNAVRIVDGVLDHSIAKFSIGHQLIALGSGESSSLEGLVGGVAVQRQTGKHPSELHGAPVWHEVERNLAHGLYNTMLHWTPSVIVLGGGMMRDIDTDRLQNEINKLPALFDINPRIVHAALEDTAGLHGALVLIRQQLRSGK